MSVLDPEQHAKVIVETLGEHAHMAVEITATTLQTSPADQRAYWMAVHAEVRRLLGREINEWDEA